MATTLPGTADTARWDLRRTLVLLTALLLSAVGTRAHAAYAQPVAHYYSPAEMQQLVGPIALYVDDLIGIVLPASAYPDQVAAAANFLDARQQDPSLQPDPYWDDSVVALLNYPEVLRLLADNPRWMRQLGEAFVYQQSDLLSAIQRFREQAMVAGNLYSDDYQSVSQSGGVIAIAPANPEVVYVPYYSPTQVIQYYPGPVITYYPYGYPLYDYPYPAGYNFSTGFFWGVTTAFIVSWHSHLVHVYPWDYDRHPYYRYRSRYQQPYYIRHVRHDHDWDRHDYIWRRDNRHDVRNRGDDDRHYPDRQHYTSRTFTQAALDRAWTQRNMQDGSGTARNTSQTFTQAALDRARNQAETRDRNRAGARFYVNPQASRTVAPPTRTVTPPARTVAPPARTVTPPPRPDGRAVEATRSPPPVRYAPPQARGGVKAAPARPAPPPARSSPPPRESNGRSGDTPRGRPDSVRER